MCFRESGTDRPDCEGHTMFTICDVDQIFFSPTLHGGNSDQNERTR